ncbi:MAG: hypothetical protein AB1736_14295 [Chloroflexota bacterium]
MQQRPEPACLLIADISGYTGYLAGVELDHAQDILADLMDGGVANQPTEGSRCNDPLSIRERAVRRSHDRWQRAAESSRGDSRCASPS